MEGAPRTARRHDRGNDRIHVAEYVARRNTQGREAALRENIVAPLVTRGLIAAGVDLAVDLDREPGAQAGEVDAVRVAGKLVAELEAARALAELLE